MRTINASEFKAKCLALLDEIARTGETLTVLKRGKPVARVVPAPASDEQYPQETLKGTVKILGDIIDPAVPASEWLAAREEG